MNSHEVFIHIHQGCFAGTGAIVRLPQCQWSKPDGYGKISLCITTTKHSKAKTVCIFLGIYCIHLCASHIFNGTAQHELLPWLSNLFLKDKTGISHVWFKNKFYSLLYLVSYSESVLMQIIKDSTDDQSTLVKVMPWCHQATSHYLNQYWLSSLAPYGIKRGWWVNSKNSLAEFHISP